MDAVGEEFEAEELANESRAFIHISAILNTTCLIQ
jgi:hypothetical protein